MLRNILNINNNYTQKNKYIKNSIVTYLQTIITIFARLLQARYLVKNLGILDFGVYSLVAGFIAVFSFINSAMTISTQRELSYDLGKGDNTRFDESFRSTLFVHITLALIFFALSSTIGLWIFKAVINIPSGKMDSAINIFIISVISFSIMIVGVPFQSVLSAYEEFSFIAIILSIRSIIILICSILLVFLPSYRLEAFCISIGFSHFTNVVLSMVWIKIKHPSLKIIPIFSFNRIKSLFSFASWNFLAALSMALKGQGVGIVINSFLGAIASASYGIANQIAVTLTTFAQSIGKVVAPGIIKKYSAGNIGETIRLVIISSQYASLIIVFLSVPLLLETVWVLNVWLGELPQYSVIMCRSIIVLTCIEILSLSLMSLAQATGVIKNYMITNSIFLLLNIPTTIAVLLFGKDIVYVFVLSIILAIFTLLSRLFFVNKLTGLKILHWLQNVLFPNVLGFFISTILALFPFLLLQPSIIRMAVIFLSSAIGCCIVFFIFNRKIITTNKEQVSL